MCIGIPMRIETCDGLVAVGEGRQGRGRIDLALTGELPPQTWVLVHQGTALREMSADEATQTNAALDALEAVLAGEGNVDAFFADLIDRTPELPPHLKGTPS